MASGDFRMYGAAGVAVAGRHIYLQNLPADEVPACTSLPLDYMLEAFPFRTVVDKVLNGSGECAVVDWTFLGLSMPSWTLVWYLAMGLGFAWVSLRQPRRG